MRGSAQSWSIGYCSPRCQAYHIPRDLKSRSFPILLPNFEKMTKTITKSDKMYDDALQVDKPYDSIAE